MAPSLALDGAETQSSLAAGLLTKRCLACHHGDDAKGKLDLTTRQKLLLGGETGPGIDTVAPENSLVWQRVLQDEMPPKHPLTDDEKQLLKSWIVAGSHWSGGALDPLAVSTEHRAGRDWWSLQPLRSVAIMRANSPVVSRQPIDDFIVGQLEAKRLRISPEADRRVLIRRASFGLLGLPPNPEDIDQFVQDQTPDAFERLIDRLLASPYYGERWARHWLDVVRFGESNGFERDLPRPHAWPYRDWVVQALNKDLPYDEFVRWQLAGDVIAPDDAEAMKAVGFLVAGAHDTVVPVVDRMRAMMRQDELEDIVGTVSQTFLGLTVNCARCHDHKFDPITTHEYYQLAAAFAGVDHGERNYTAPEITRQLAQWQIRIDFLSTQLREQDIPIRSAILTERAAAKSLKVPVVRSLPSPAAAWDFTRDPPQSVAGWPVELIGSAKMTHDGLVLDGASFARTGPLPFELKEKTLEVRVQLATLTQGGGGAISVQSLDGHTFDAIVYSELEPRRWMPGSNGHQRTLSYQGTPEELADHQAVVFTQVHRADGTILGFRNGQPYGTPIRKDPVVVFEAGKSQVVFGLRHGTEVGGNRALIGTIVHARLFNKALLPEEVAISADATNTVVVETEVLERLTAEEQRIRIARGNELVELQRQYADLSRNGHQQVYTAIATQTSPMRVHVRGSVTSLGDEVASAGLTAIQGLEPNLGLRSDAIESQRRLRLANWITDARNPLFARVMSNRIWHYHFGTGLVETPNDLGFHAGNPSHPELLEWLALEFRGIPRNESADGAVTNAADPRAFSLKRMHRLMITSATYRQSSASDPTAISRDANNRWLWRMSPRRLEAEAVRDAMLTVAGELNDEIGGKGYSDVNSHFFKGTQFYDPIDPIGFGNQRRTLYRMGARGGRSPFLDTFDCPDPSTTTPRRSTTVTPLQALSLLNHSFSLRMANRFADRIRQESHSTPEAQVQQSYRRLFGREPDVNELDLSRDFVVRHGLPAYCRAMWNSSEFLFLD